MTVKEINGYDYIGYLSVPVLELELPVMSEWDYQRLRRAPCRQFGSTKTDDLVIAAHNYPAHFGRFSQLHSGDLLTFTDLDGSLLALKPDITLSIIRSTNSPRKVYYNENVYRVPRGALSFKEIMQAGLECIGELDTYSVAEVLSLASKSLELISPDYVLDVSHMGIISALVDGIGLSARGRAQLLACIGEKNLHGIDAICADEGTIQHEKTIGYYQQAVLLAAELGAKYLLITGSGANYDYAPERLMDSAEKTLRVLADFAGEHGVTLLLSSVLGEECIPNASTPVLVSMEEIRDMAERVNSEYLKVYLDTEVISLRGETITEWFETFGEDIRLVRFTDGNYNGYRIWGMGCFPCRKYLDEIGRTGFGGAFALTVPGERYADRPAEAMAENLQVLRQMMGQV
jgi:sugar phosphate isomerase/epimerase